MSDLLLKATPALLEGWCGPVVVPNAAGAIPGVLAYRTNDDQAWWAVCHDDPDGPEVFTWPEQAIQLDLSRAECRSRVIRCLTRWRWRSGTLPDSVGWYHRRRIGWPGDDPHGRNRWVLHDNERGAMEFMPAWAPKAEGNVPALLALDPNDDTRLPDGSRLVDAQALLAVAKEVLNAKP